MSDQHIHKGESKVTDFVTLTCPSCGAKLQITDDIERFACTHCGNEHIVKRAGGLVALAPVVQAIKQVRDGVDKTASELAIKRLLMEIAELEKQKQHRLISSVDYIWTGVFAGLGIGFVAFCIVTWTANRALNALGHPEPELGIIAGTVVSLGMAAGGYIWGFVKQRAKNKVRCAPIDQEIARRKRELAKHRKIVSS